LRTGRRGEYLDQRERKREKREGWRTLHNEELHNFISSPNNIKSRKM
jgi:hypothetical protein